MEGIWESLMHLKDYILNPKLLIDWMLLKLGAYVYVGLFFIIFAETGLAVGFFLPGDSLLVVAGLFAAAGKLNLAILMSSLFVAAVIGSTEDVWSDIFRANGQSYRAPRLRLYSGATAGGAASKCSISFRKREACP